MRLQAGLLTPAANRLKPAAGSLKSDRLSQAMSVSHFRLRAFTVKARSGMFIAGMSEVRYMKTGQPSTAVYAAPWHFRQLGFSR